jgi:hypothetical protein
MGDDDAERSAPCCVRTRHYPRPEDLPTIWEVFEAAHYYVPHIRRLGEEKLDPATGEQRFPARRWVVEQTLAWLSKCRVLLIGYDKQSANFLGLLQFVCALLCFRRLHRLSLVR